MTLNISQLEKKTAEETFETLSWEILDGSIQTTKDIYGNYYAFIPRVNKDIDLFIGTDTSFTKKIGSIIEREGKFLFKKREKEADIMNIFFAWSIPKQVLKNVVGIRYTTINATYTITAKKAREVGIEAPFGGKGLDKKVYVPIKHWKVKFKNPQLDKIAQTVGLSWTLFMLPVWEGHKLQSTLKLVAKHLKAGATIYPERKNFFRALQLTPLHNVKVVILGQDPYHTPGMATGLAFGTRSSKIPPSLQNIKKEVYSDLEIENDLFNTEDTFDYSLEHWAKQGVLLLNTSLSVEKGEPGSHAGFGWDKAIVKPVIKAILEKQKHVVFILWGAHAAKTVGTLEESGQVKIIKSRHPSPFSADKGFFGSKPFSKTNKWLKENGLKEIRWT